MTIRACSSLIIFEAVLVKKHGITACIRQTHAASSRRKPKPDAITRCSPEDSLTDAGCARNILFSMAGALASDGLWAFVCEAPAAPDDSKSLAHLLWDIL